MSTNSISPTTTIDKTAELGTRSIRRLLFIYALPAVISQVISSIYNLCDRIFIGNGVGDLAIAGLAITMPIMNIIHAFGSLVGAGSAARISIVLGRKDYRWAEQIVGNSMLLTFFFGALFVPASYIFMDPILALFGASPDTIAYAEEYLRVVIPGMFFTTMTFNLTGLIRATGYPTRSMWILCSGAILNVGLDALFIFGFGWGIAGAAWATTIAMFISAMLAVAHFVSKKSFIRFRRHAWAPKWYIFRNITMIGISPFLMNVCGAGVVAILNKQALLYGGDLSVGAIGLVNSYSNILMLFIMGICQGMQPIAGYNYGAGLSHRLKEIYRLTVFICITVGLLGTLIAFLFPRTLLSMFGPSPEMMSIGVIANYFLLAMYPLIGYTITNSQFFMSIDKPWISIVTSLSRQLLFLVPMVYIIPNLCIDLNIIDKLHIAANPTLPDTNGMLGVFASCTISDVLGFVLALCLFLTQRKVFRPNYVHPERRPRKEAGPDKAARNVTPVSTDPNSHPSD